MGPDGRMIQEKYFDNNAVARGTNGHTVASLLILRLASDSKAIRTATESTASPTSE